MKNKIRKTKKTFEKFIAWKETESFLLDNMEKYKNNCADNIFNVARDAILSDIIQTQKSEENVSKRPLNNPLSAYFVFHFNSQFGDSTPLTRYSLSQTFEETLSILIPLNPPTMYAFAAAVELASFSEYGKEPDQSLVQTFKAFIGYRRWKYLTENYETAEFFENNNKWNHYKFKLCYKCRFK